MEIKQEFSLLKDENKFVMVFKKNQPFDENILIRAQSFFEQLDRFKKLYVDIHGMIPLEILAYVLEVSNYCNMIVTIFDDDKGYGFLNQLKNNIKSNVKLILKGEEHAEPTKGL